MFQCLEIMVAGSAPKLGEGFAQRIGPLLNDSKPLNNVIKDNSDGSLPHSTYLDVINETILVVPEN